MAHEAESADLVLVLGTSLGGLNADRVAHETARRSLRNKSLGTVIISPQQTEHDGAATIRIFGESDAVLTRLLAKMGMSSLSLSPPSLDNIPRRVLVPYDVEGNRTDDSTKMWLDLSPGGEIKLALGHNIAGAGQPHFRHMERIAQPRGYVQRWNNSTAAVELVVEGTGMLLGQWWIEAAQRGGPATIPVVNAEPVVVHD